MNELNVSNDFQEKDEQAIKIRDMVNLVLRKWFWFVLSLFVCLSIAAVYLMMAPYVYERTATVLIKDDLSGSGETSLFQDLPVFRDQNNVNNEMIVFKSKRLMMEAIRRLKIDISYTVKDKLRKQELYTKSPVAISFINMEESQRASFKARLSTGDEIELWAFRKEEFEDDQPIKAKLNDTIVTPVGTLVVTPTLWYNEAWFDQTITIKKSVFMKVVDRYCHALTVDLADRQSSVVNLTIRDVSVQRAEDVLNTVIAVYNEDAITVKNTMASNTEKFINERLDIIENELGDVDTQIMSYKMQHQITDIQSVAQIALQGTSEADQMINITQSRLAMAEYMRTYLSNPSNHTVMIPNTVIDDLNLGSQITGYNETLVKRNRLIENSSERNPVVQELNNELTARHQNIMRAVENLIVNLKIQLQSEKTRTERLRARVTAIPQQQSAVTTITRQQKIKEELFLYLLNKREENALNKAITESTARIIDVALGSPNPVEPRRMMLLMAAFLLGLAIPSSVFFLMMASDITVRGRKDLTSVLSIPFLGEIPFKKMKNKVVVVKQSGRDHVSEAFRIIRTNMDFLRVRHDDLKVIMTTSTNVGSGKTFVSSNLAVSLAMTGKKVLLIDMDIRKGTLGKELTTNGKDAGLTSYLSKFVNDVESLIIQDDNYPGIDIIPAGPTPPNPAELLLSERLDDLVNELRHNYDYIVIDNVPCRMVADAIISNRVADLTLYVVRAGKLDRRLLPDIEQLYREEKLKNMAMILNGVNPGYGYGYGYGDRYGYGYGYGNDQ